MKSINTKVNMWNMIIFVLLQTLFLLLLLLFQYYYKPLVMVYPAEIITTFIPYPWHTDLFIHNSILFEFCIKYLLIFSSPEYTTATVDTDSKQLELTLADLQRATEEIRGLHSINSELRSQLEVLSSRFVNRHSSRPGTRVFV